MVKPILLYNSEIWGSKVCDGNKLLNIDVEKTRLYHQTGFEKMHLRWCKHILGVHSKSSNNDVLSELGRYPLMIDIFVKQIKFWKRLTTVKDNSLLYDAYKENECMITNEQSCWLKSVAEIN